MAIYDILGGEEPTGYSPYEAPKGYEGEKLKRLQQVLYNKGYKDIEPDGEWNEYWQGALEDWGNLNEKEPEGGSANVSKWYDWRNLRTAYGESDPTLFQQKFFKSNPTNTSVIRSQEDIDDEMKKIIENRIIKNPGYYRAGYEDGTLSESEASIYEELEDDDLLPEDDISERNVSKEEYYDEILARNDEESLSRYKKMLDSNLIGQMALNSIGFSNAFAKRPDAVMPKRLQAPELRGTYAEETALRNSMVGGQNAIALRTGRETNRGEFLPGMMSAIGENTLKADAGIAGNLNELYNKQDAVNMEVSNKNVELDYNAKMADAERVSKDNLMRSEMLSKTMSNIGKITTDYQKGILNYYDNQNKNIFLKKMMEDNNLQGIATALNEFIKFRSSDARFTPDGDYSGVNKKSVESGVN